MYSSDGVSPLELVHFRKIGLICVFLVYGAHFSVCKVIYYRWAMGSACVGYTLPGLPCNQGLSLGLYGVQGAIKDNQAWVTRLKAKRAI